MSTKQDLSFGARDQGTGAAVAQKYAGQGNATVNSFPVSVTDAASSNLQAYAVGEAPVTLSATPYTIPDPQAGSSNPSSIRCHTTTTAFIIALPLHPYDGMKVRVSDIDGNAGANHMIVGPQGASTDQVETYPSNGTFVSAPSGAVVNANGASVTWEFCGTAGSGKWKIVGNN